MDCLWKQRILSDAGGKDTLELSYDWDSDAQSWLLQGKSEFSYDAGGNLIMILKYELKALAIHGSPSGSLNI